MGEPPLLGRLSCGTAKPQSSRRSSSGAGELGVQPTLEKFLCWLSLSLKPSGDVRGSLAGGCLKEWEGGLCVPQPRGGGTGSSMSCTQPSHCFDQASRGCLGGVPRGHVCHLCPALSLLPHVTPVFIKRVLSASTALACAGPQDHANEAESLSLKDTAQPGKTDSGSDGRHLASDGTSVPPSVLAAPDRALGSA